MTDQPSPRANNVLIESLESSIQRGGHALADVPGLLKRVLAEEAWRVFETRRGEVVRHERFADFVTTDPLRGLGADMDLIGRIVGTGDPDLLRLLHDANKGRRGRPSRGEINNGESPSFSVGDDTTSLAAQRLAIEAPEEYEAVQRGEQTINRAAIRAGIRRRRIPIRLDSADSAARTLRAHMPPDTRRALARLLMDD